MFRIGDYVAHYKEGVCEVVNIGKIDMGSSDKEYYTLKPVYDAGGTVYTPVDNKRDQIRKLITKEEAEKLGYIIPDNYKETSVPKLNFDRIDKILQPAYDNGLGLRGHTLLWHSQTPAWFFGIDYDADEDAVDEDTMDARIDIYV